MVRSPLSLGEQYGRQRVSGASLVREEQYFLISPRPRPREYSISSSCRCSTVEYNRPCVKHNFTYFIFRFNDEEVFRVIASRICSYITEISEVGHDGGRCSGMVVVVEVKSKTLPCYCDSHDLVTFNRTSESAITIALRIGYLLPDGLLRGMRVDIVGNR